jgi:hypothetical protein
MRIPFDVAAIAGCKANRLAHIKFYFKTVNIEFSMRI